MLSVFNKTIGKVFAEDKEKLVGEIEELLLCDFFDSDYRDFIREKVKDINESDELKNLTESVRLCGICFEHIETMAANTYITADERAKYYEKCKVADNKKLEKIVVVLELAHKLLERIQTMRPKEINENYRARMSQKIKAASLLFKLDVLQEIEKKIAKTSALIGTMNQLYHDKCFDDHVCTDILERLNHADIDEAEFSEIENRISSKTWGQRFDTASNVAGGVIQVAEVASKFSPASVPASAVMTALQLTKGVIDTASKNNQTQSNAKDKQTSGEQK